MMVPARKQVLTKLACLEPIKHSGKDLLNMMSLRNGTCSLFGIGVFVRTRGFTRTWFHAGNKRKYRCSSLAYWMQLHCGSRSVSCQLASKNWWSLTRNANERQRELMNSNRTLRFFSIFNGIILLFTNNNTASYLSFSIIPSFVNYNWQQKLH
jgi:hypothetical protein